ncbi:MAG: hypothetical protein K8L97_14190 [Anaerolineae bacterium]|nr:hypothetical protein [Anaerolineae bacterium]
MVFRIMNFGPAALDSGDSLYQISGVLAAQSVTGTRIVAIVSAMLGVTDLLLDSIKLGNYSNVYTKLLTAHKNVARRQGKDELSRQVLIQDITDILDSYNWLGKSLSNRGPTPTEADTIALLGEKLCARLLAASLQNRGVRAVIFNAGELIARDGLPAPDLQATNARVETRLLPSLQQGFVAVVTASLDVETAEHSAHPTPGSELLCANTLAKVATPDEIWLWSDAGNYTVRPA